MSKWTIARETVSALGEDAPAHWADAAGMLESLISAAIGAMAAEKDAAHVNHFTYHEVSSINLQHVDVQRLT